MNQNSEKLKSQKIPRQADFVIRQDEIKNPNVKAKKGSNACFYLAILFCLLNVAIVVVAILTFTGYIDLPIFEQPCRLVYKFHEPEFNLEYRFSYCDRGNFCEAIINLEDDREVMPPSCRYDE